MKLAFISLLGLAAIWAASTAPSPKMAFWDSQRRGANCFNKKVTPAWYQAASDLGLGFVRLVPDKWKGQGRDFLIGDCDNFQGLVSADFDVLKASLDEAHKHNQKIAFGMLSLPGCRWKQNNGDKEDYRLWKDETYQLQAIAFWRELASRLKDHSALVAYNILNEPHPEREDEVEGGAALNAWVDKHRGTTQDLNRFYQRIITAIREVDPATPIFIEGYGYGSAEGLAALQPMADPNVLYSLHFYEPWQYTSKGANKGRYAYPASMPDSWDAPGRAWTQDDLKRRMDPVAQWAEKNKIPIHRIIAAEFGVQRDVEGSTAYLTDVVQLLNGYGWHWAFYAFREDVWEGMDYEFGTGKMPGTYWEQMEKGEEPSGRKQDGPLFGVLKREFNQ